MNHIPQAEIDTEINAMHQQCTELQLTHCGTKERYYSELYFLARILNLRKYTITDLNKFMKFGIKKWNEITIMKSYKESLIGLSVNYKWYFGDVF